MFCKSLGNALTGAVLLVFTSTATAQDKTDDQVKKLVAQFVKALKTKDIDAVMKTVDVPWFNDGQEIIRERDKLKGEFQKLLAQKNYTDLQVEINRILSHAEFMEKFGARVNEAERKLLEEVMSKDDRVVLVTVDNQQRQNRAFFFVRVKKDEVKLAGLRD